MSEKDSDLTLVKLTLANPDDYVFLVERYEAKLLRYIRRITNVSVPEAEDLLQNVFLKAYQNLNDFDPKLKFSSWIYRIAHNEVISNWRKKSARAEEVNLDEKDMEAFFTAAFSFDSAQDKTASEELDAKILSKKVHEILSRLPIKYREVLILRFIEEKDYAEISDIIRKPGGTVATLIARAKKAFKQIAERHYALIINL